MVKAPPLQVAAATDPGRERSNNEDRVLCEPDLGIYAVIDGVGGESAGEVAAETAAEVLRARLSRRTTDSARLVREAIALANRQIYERARGDARLAGMSCVLTVAVVDGASATVGHVGDSRLYALAPGTIRKVTPDHSPVGAREDAGELSESEAMRHPRRNEIFRDVGSAPHEPDEESWIDVLEVPLAADGALLLCSDGLSDMISSREILDAVERHAASPRAAVRALIDRANAAGGRDNVSVVLVEGERYAEAVRRRSRAGGAARPSAPPVPAAPVVASAPAPPAAVGAPVRQGAAGAAWARASTGERLRDWFAGSGGRWLVLGLVVAAALVAWLGFGAPLGRWVRGLTGGGAAPGTSAPSSSVLRVGTGDGGLATLGEALRQAQAGQTIEVAPGEYRERIVLRDGVTLVSLVPRKAVLLAPHAAAGAGAASAGEAVVAADGVHGATMKDFVVSGGAAAAVRLVDSEVTLDGVEITGATGAGVEIRGSDRSVLRWCAVHQNGGPGVAVVGAAAPRLLGNLIYDNGRAPGAPAPGVLVEGSAAPLLADNRIEGNSGVGVFLPSPERVEEIFRWNTFATAVRDQAVRAGGAGGAGGGGGGAAAGARGGPPAGGGGTAGASAGAGRRRP